MILNGVNSSPLSPMTNNSETYYGIWYPKSCFTLDFDESECLPLVVKNQEEVKVILKKYKACRFKATKSREEALIFAKMPPEQILSPYIIKKVNGEDEKGSAFRAPKSQDIVKLRLAIDRGDEETFKQTVWVNPRYLVGQADNPTIFHDGARYNALHIAAKCKHGPKMCRLLIETIENPAFMQLMYSDEKPADCLRRTKYLVDLYFNMRDKGFNETPLHFAAKFGAVEVVSILVSHPACDQTLGNKYGDTAKSIALSRCPPQTVTSELKAAMTKAFEDKYFVAILVNSDESSPPYVSEPMSPAKRNRTLQELVLEKQSNSILATPVMRALAGPMSENEAKDFHKLLKSPSRLLPPQTFRSIKLSDMEKGYERIGRCQAKRMNVQWKEQWPFGYCDVSKESGLEMLEQFLNSRWEELLLKVVEDVSNNTADYSSNSDDFNTCSSTSNEISPISSLCMRLENLELTSPVKNPTMALFQDNNNYETGDYNNELENDYANRLCKDIARQLGETMEKERYLNDEDIRDLLASFNCLRSSQGVGRMSSVHGEIAELIAEDIDFDVNVCQTNLLIQEANDRSFNDDGDEKLAYRVNNHCLQREEEVLSNFIKLEEHVNCIFHQLRLLCAESQMETHRKSSASCTCTWAEEEDEFFTPPTSPTNSCDSSEDDYLSPSDELDLFMNGVTPSKLDVDVLRALADTEINPLLYPNIHKWKCLVASYSLEETEKWKGPMTPKKKLEDFNIKNNGTPIRPIPILNLSPPKDNY